MRVLRGMRTASDGLPMVGPTARTLGARPGSPPEGDIPIVRGAVSPETGGMSVSPPPPSNLPTHRRPPEHGGRGRDAVWELDTDDLAVERTLRYRPDPDSPETHGFIEPARRMSLEEYQKALSATRGLWRPLR
jgi:hypothetical protein